MRILPLHVMSGGQDLLETEVDMDGLLAQLRRREHLPGTSSASVGEVLQCYEWAAERATSVVSIHLSGAFSKSYGAALEARTLALERFPHLRIEVIDSRTAEAGELLIAVGAGRLAMQGADFAQVVEHAYRIRDELCLFYCFDTLFYRDKGGRAFKAKAWAEAEAQSETGFRALARVDCSTDGIVRPVCRAKGKRQLFRKMVQTARERLDGRPLAGAMVHVNAPQQVDVLQQMLAEETNCDSLLVSRASPTTTIHSGEGFISFGFHPVTPA